MSDIWDDDFAEKGFMAMMPEKENKRVTTDKSLKQGGLKKKNRNHKNCTSNKKIQSFVGLTPPRVLTFEDDDDQDSSIMKSNINFGGWMDEKVS